MTRYVADTHALFWYLSGSPLLSSAARAAFDEAKIGTSEVIVPAIAIAELIMLAEKRRIAIDIDHIMSTLGAFPGFRFTALTPAIAKRIRTLKALRDIHDRLIVAEALEADAILITFDQLITASRLVPVVW